ncbi:MAG: tRNA (guanosine(37)-N1)-methyltransferase TrmD [bacterium]
MKISILSVFPEIYDSFIKISLVDRAIKNGIVEFNLIRFSDLVEPKKRMDEPTCGPGVGMIIKPEVIQAAIEQSEKKWGPGFKVFFSAQGQKIDQKILNTFVEEFVGNPLGGNVSKNTQHIILVCARYEGIDDRVEQHYADLVLSIGDYVLMGGDLPAQVFIEAFLRLISGVVGKTESVEKESFQTPFLDYPQFGLPKEWKGEQIPEILLSGDHAKIENWRKEQSCEKTLLNRFDWLRSQELTRAVVDLCNKFIPNHYVALMHTDVIVNNKSGNTSITSLDIHDIARSGKTYGIKNYFVVTKIEDQLKILKEFLNFWLSDIGKEYNLSRYQAVERVLPARSLDDVIKQIREKEGTDPIIITTSAKDFEHKEKIDFNSQGLVWKQKKPVLFLFGTGQGLSDEILQRSDYLLLPIEGLTDYNHLSVRSAAAIIMDRFLGLQPKKTYIEQLKKRLKVSDIKINK